MAVTLASKRSHAVPAQPASRVAQLTVGVQADSLQPSARSAHRGTQALAVTLNCLHSGQTQSPSTHERPLPHAARARRCQAEQRVQFAKRGNRTARRTRDLSTTQTSYAPMPSLQNMACNSDALLSGGRNTPAAQRLVLTHAALLHLANAFVALPKPTQADNAGSFNEFGAAGKLRQFVCPGAQKPLLSLAMAKHDKVAES